MIEASQMVHICLMDGTDGRTSDERLPEAVAAYCKELGMAPIAPEQLRVVRPERGKPYFAELPELHFSISHSGAYWACAFADCEVGLDLQEHVRLKKETWEEAAQRFQRMAHRFFHPVEAKFVELDRYPNFFTVWAAREAYVKYTGQGIDTSFSEHCVVPEEKAWDKISGLADDVSWEAQGARFWKCRYDEAYTLCVCTKEKRIPAILCC